MTYRTVVADPPWCPELGGAWRAPDKARPQHHYSTLSVSEIARLSPPTAKQAHLYLWAIAQHVDWAYEIARAWGFQPIILWTWKKPGLGVGRFRCNTEHVLVARKGPRQGNPFGAMGRVGSVTDGTLFEWPRGGHSEKPEAFLDLVERISPGPYLEMFARRKRLGWSVWGDEVDSDIEIGVVR